MSSNIFKPNAGGIRQPTDPKQVNGDIINPPRYAELGGLTGPGKIKHGVNNSAFDLPNLIKITKPGG